MLRLERRLGRGWTIDQKVLRSRRRLGELDPRDPRRGGDDAGLRKAEGEVGQYAVESTRASEVSRVRPSAPSDNQLANNTRAVPGLCQRRNSSGSDSSG